MDVQLCDSVSVVRVLLHHCRLSAQFHADDRSGVISARIWCGARFSGKSESIQPELHSCRTVRPCPAFILHLQTPSQTGKINSLVEHPASLPSLLLLPQQKIGRVLHSGTAPASSAGTGKTMRLCCLKCIIWNKFPLNIFLALHRALSFNKSLY